ncbi:hypothetical protein JCM10213_008999 [Rhodosporidiobolus nylandii]
MPAVPVRAHTHADNPNAFTGSGLDYRTYNRYYEAYLARCYSPSVKPFTLGPSHIWTKYTSDFGTSIREDAADLVRGIILEDFGLFFREGIVPALFERWRGYTVREREDHCLRVWESQQKRAEEEQFLYRRAEAPELTLAWAKDANNLEKLVHALYSDKETASREGISYRHVPSPDGSWERLNLVADGVPASRGLRAFCEEGRIMRALYLAQFSFTLLHDIPQNDQHKIVINSASGTKHCASCLVPETKKVLTCCSRCKPVGRFAWYCGPVCFKAAWSAHKKTCGKPLAELASSTHGARKEAPTLIQLKHLEWLAKFPIAVYGHTVQADGGRPQIMLMQLPPYVRPYLPTLEAMKALRDRAVKGKESLDVGLLGRFICAVSPPGGEMTANDHLELLAELLGFKVAEVKRNISLAEEKVDGVDALVLSCLQQIEDGVPDPAFPDQNLPGTALTFLNELLANPSTFYSFTVPERSGRFAVPLPSFISPFDTALSALRSFAMRSLLSSGADRTAVGYLMLFAFAASTMEDKTGAVPLMRRLQVREVEGMLGLRDGDAEAAISAADKALEVRKDEEGKLLQDVLRQLRERTKAFVASGRAAGSASSADPSGINLGSGGSAQKSKGKKRK